ncbi:hypothetical protein M8371_27815, partial [Klebsiella pneumoniae]|nr:hypothetical protein [Klebsiella pneumoniae]
KKNPPVLSWGGVWAWGIGGQTACERGTAIFLFIGFEPYFTRCFYLAQVIRFSPLTLPPKLKNLNIV